MTETKWAAIIGEVVKRLAHIESPTEAGLQIPTGKDNILRWRAGNRGVPRGPVKRALLDYARRTFPADMLKKYGVPPKGDGNPTLDATDRAQQAKERGRGATRRRRRAEGE